MRISWLAPKDLGELVRLGQSEGWLMDAAELEHMRVRFPTLFFGAYDGKFLVGAISGYFHEKSGWIGNFIVKPELRKQGIGRRLFETLLKAMQEERPYLMLHAEPGMAPFYEKYGFVKTREVQRLERKPAPTTFRFTPQQARALEDARFHGVMESLDHEFFRENRMTYLLEDLSHKSSLMLATANGMLHSKVVGSKHVFIGPFLVREGAYMDAERLLRGLLFYRGMKQIVCDVPAGMADMGSLYHHYDFEDKSRTVQMVRGENPHLVYEGIYAFASSGVCG